MIKNKFITIYTLKHPDNPCQKPLNNNNNNNNFIELQNNNFIELQNNIFLVFVFLFLRLF